MWVERGILKKSPQNNEKKQKTVVQHPGISIICGCNRYFWKFECGILQKYGFTNSIGGWGAAPKFPVENSKQKNRG